MILEVSAFADVDVNFFPRFNYMSRFQQNFTSFQNNGVMCKHFYSNTSLQIRLHWVHIFTCLDSHTHVNFRIFSHFPPVFTYEFFDIFCVFFSLILCVFLFTDFWRFFHWLRFFFHSFHDFHAIFLARKKFKEKIARKNCLKKISRKNSLKKIVRKK